ncbi:MAG: hypothetical protein KA010_03495 [Saprospiraceae bacterium]|nr:hypothetical protein [Saprospiraceae bacterium]
MKNKNFNIYAILVSMLILVASGCTINDLDSETIEDDPLYSGDGLSPIYIDKSELKNIKNLPSRTIENSGTIFLKDTIFFLLEINKGIHVFNTSIPSNSTPLTFINIPAASDFTVHGDKIYASCWRDLVTIDFSDLFNVKEVAREENVFEPTLFPQRYNGYFECVDERRGVVINWEHKILENAACRTL